MFHWSHIEENENFIFGALNSIILWVLCTLCGNKYYFCSFKALYCIVWWFRVKRRTTNRNGWYESYKDIGACPVSISKTVILNDLNGHGAFRYSFPLRSKGGFGREWTGSMIWMDFTFDALNTSQKVLLKVFIKTPFTSIPTNVPY